MLFRVQVYTSTSDESCTGLWHLETSVWCGGLGSALSLILNYSIFTAAIAVVGVFCSD